MTKADIVNDIARKTGLDKAAVLAIVESLMETVKESLVNEEEVTLRGFGSFQIKERAQKLGRNIRAEKGVIIPAHNVPLFKPADAFKEMLAPGLTHQEA